MDLVRPEFVDRVKFYAEVWWPARSLVAAALERRFDVHPCGRIIEFASGGCPYKEHLYELEEEQVTYRAGLVGAFYLGCVNAAGKASHKW